MKNITSPRSPKKGGSPRKASPKATQPQPSKSRLQNTKFNLGLAASQDLKKNDNLVLTKKESEPLYKKKEEKLTLPKKTLQVESLTDLSIQTPAKEEIPPISGVTLV